MAIEGNIGFLEKNKQYAPVLHLSILKIIVFLIVVSLSYSAFADAEQELKDIKALIGFGLQIIIFCMGLHHGGQR